MTLLSISAALQKLDDFRMFNLLIYRQRQGALEELIVVENTNGLRGPVDRPMGDPLCKGTVVVPRNNDPIDPVIT